MEVMHPRCGGVDMHKRDMKITVITPEKKETRTFPTVMAGLLKGREWLRECRVTHVAIESTGVLWKGLYNLLEGEFEVLVVNPRHVKAIPGRKTDVKDSEWLADLLRHGLVRGSFIPDRAQRELRELTRYRRTVIQERADEVNRIQKVLEGGNVKLSSVATNVVGVSGRAMLEAMIRGLDDPQALAALAKGKLKNKQADLVEALRGLVGPHQRAILASQLRHLDFLDAEIERLDGEVAQRMHSAEEDMQRMDDVPGIARRAAEDILAEIGVDMSRFPSADHISSWAKMCPGMNETGGKRKSGRTGHGNPWLRSILVQAAWAASHTKRSYLSAQYHRIAARRGAKRAIIAVAHSILVIIYMILRHKRTYQDLGAQYFDHRNRQAVAERAVRRLQSLGYKVTIEEAPQNVPAPTPAFSG